jgi:hypothetical protein
MIQDDNKKAELFNDYFFKQADLNDSENSVPDITDILGQCFFKNGGHISIFPF